MRLPLPLLFLTLPLALMVSTQCFSAEPSTFAGVTGATLMHSGFMVVEDEGRFVRTEGFEFVQRSDGGITLLNTTHAKEGRYRVRGQFDYNGDWQSTRARGIGLYAVVPVSISLTTQGTAVAISVEGDGVSLNPSATCDPDCLLNMSPSAVAMITMTRFNDHSKGGEQLFRWARPGSQAHG